MIETKSASYFFFMHFLTNNLIDFKNLFLQTEFQYIKLIAIEVN